MYALLLQRIGRITGRLPKQLADEVVGALMELFSPTESESAWHGGEWFLTTIAKEQLIGRIVICSPLNGDIASDLLLETSAQLPHLTRLTALFSRTTRVSRYQYGKTNLDFIEARDSEWQWQQLGHMQVCISLQTDNLASIPPLSFFTGRVPLPAAQPTASKHWRQ